VAWKHVRTFGIHLSLTYALIAPVGTVYAALFEGDVVEVIDGDSIVVRDSANNRHELRLAEVDAPEKAQVFGQKSKRALSAKLLSKRVQVFSKTKDRYGRHLAHVYSEGKWINLVMVREGLAWHSTRHSSTRDISDAQSEARSAKRGLWATAQPTPPWDFRAKGPTTPSPTFKGTPARQLPRERSAGRKHWLNTATGVRHNHRCVHYGKTSRGRVCSAEEGRPCRRCGG
jgi:endonuclease YncB( thermonuclease family)